jgi:hypothetical protein
MGRSGGGGKFASTRQCHCNWEHTKVIALISHKHAEQSIQKQLVNPRTQMILFVQHLDKIIED